MGRHHSRARRSCGTARRAPRTPRPKARPTGACSTRCGITPSGWPSGTWSGGSSIAPTYLDPGRPFDREARAELAERLPQDPGGVLREVARARLLHHGQDRMAHSRAHSPILEQPRHRWLWLALSAGLILLAAGSGFLLRGEREQEPVNHAFAVPAVRGRVMVEVLNGTRRQGVARTATRMLRGRGLDVVFLGNADSAEALTRVIVRRGDPDRAQQWSDVLGAGMIVVETDTFRRVDVSVILGDSPT